MRVVAQTMSLAEEVKENDPIMWEELLNIGRQLAQEEGSINSDDPEYAAAIKDHIYSVYTEQWMDKLPHALAAFLVSGWYDYTNWGEFVKLLVQDLSTQG